jgi:hypothetical protein
MPRSNVLDRVRKLTAQTARALTVELRAIESEKSRLTADLDAAADHIRVTLKQLGHSSSGNDHVAKIAATKKVRAGKRIRRTLDQLKDEANAIIQFVKNAGSEGVSGNDIRERHAKIGPDLKGFVTKYSGKKLKTTGVARSMRYFVS